MIVPVIPAKAGIQSIFRKHLWMPDRVRHDEQHTMLLSQLQ